MKNSRKIFGRLAFYALVLIQFLLAGCKINAQTVSWGSENYFIGNYAGWYDVRCSGTIIIGDYKVTDTIIHQSNSIYIDWNWEYFKTDEGKEMHRFLHDWFFISGAKWHPKYVKPYLNEYWLKKISNYYNEKRKGCSPKGID